MKYWIANFPLCLFIIFRSSLRLFSEENVLGKPTYLYWRQKFSEIIMQIGYSRYFHSTKDESKFSMWDFLQDDLCRKCVINMQNNFPVSEYAHIIRYIGWAAILLCSVDSARIRQRCKLLDFSPQIWIIFDESLYESGYSVLHTSNKIAINLE